jgi:hypothetical protein
MRTINTALAVLTLITLSISTQAAVPGAEALAGVILDEFDTNADAKLDQGEWQGGIGDSFGSLDTNGDGSIASNEVDGIKGDLASKTGDLTASVLVVVVKQVLLALDSDKDRLVSKKEYDTLSNDVFEKLDSDKDKILGKAELSELPVKLIAQ